MFPRAVLWVRPLAILVLGYFPASVYGAGLDTVPEAVPTSSTAMIQLDFVPQAPEISKLSGYFSSFEKTPSQILLAYYHPLVQELVYSGNQAGPAGTLYLPDGRRLETELLYSVFVAGEQRRLIPGIDNASVQMQIQPGKISEMWSWPDGIVLTRSYFQMNKGMGVGVRCTVHNQSGRSLQGLRFGVHLQEPEMTAGNDPAQQVERDDELFADPREAILFQRDYLIREESWLAHGWSQEGGFIKAGEHSSVHPHGEPLENELSGLVVSIETPAKDLDQGQFFTASFYSSWGIDRETVAGNMRKLRKNDDFYAWETANQQRSLQGMTVTTSHQELDFYFQMLKTWAGWMVCKDKYAAPGLTQVNSPDPVLPENLFIGVEGFLALGIWNHAAIENYLDDWFDQRAETVDIAYVILIACRYFQATHNEEWLAANILRLKELTKYFVDMDHNDNGLPEYHSPRKTYPDNYTILPIESELQDKPLDFVKNVCISISAFREVAVVLRHNRMETNPALAVVCENKAKQGAKILEQTFWYPDLGSEGYYAYAVVKNGDYKIPIESIDPIWAVIENIGAPVKQKKVFQELWTHGKWRDRFERYRRFIVDQANYISQSRQSTNSHFAISQTMLRLGLENKKSADQAFQRLTDYLEGVVYHPGVLAMPGHGGSDRSGVCIENLNFIEMLLKGLCGLEPLPEGLRIALPAMEQDFSLEIKNFSFRKTKINVKIKGKGRRGEIFVDGRKVIPGTILSNRKLNKKQVTIKIVRKPAPKKRKR